MEDLVNKTLNSLNNGNKVVDLKFAFKIFLEGIKDIYSENSSLKLELTAKCDKITSLEAQVKELKDDKIDLINSIEFNAASIKSLETSVTKINNNASSVLTNHSIEGLQDSIDSTNQYARRGALTMAGKSLPTYDKNENSKEIIIDQLRRHAKYNLNTNDISIAHRLGPKPKSGPDKRSIRFRLCRRDLAEGIVSAAKQFSAPFYLNPSLTPLRNNLLYALRQLKKKKPEILKSCRANLKGELEAYTVRSQSDENTSGRPGNNLRKTVITTKKDLENFCNTLLNIPLGSVKVNWQQADASNE